MILLRKTKKRSSQKCCFAKNLNSFRLDTADYGGKGDANEFKFESKREGPNEGRHGAGLEGRFMASHWLRIVCIAYIFILILLYLIQYKLSIHNFQSKPRFRAGVRVAGYFHGVKHYF